MSRWVNQYVKVLLEYFFDCCLGVNDSDALIFEVNETGNLNVLIFEYFSILFFFYEILEDKILYLIYFNNI